MLYREAAVRISQTVMTLSRELRVSVAQMHQYQKEGKVTEEQAGTHMHKVNVILEILYTELLDPIITGGYPDLGAECQPYEGEYDNPPHESEQPQI